MNYRYGNIMKAGGILVCTTNAFIKNNGSLVMGRGLAKTVRDCIPRSDAVLGKLISTTSDRGNSLYKTYGLIGLEYKKPVWGFMGLYAFQVKHNFKDKANPKLISLSVQDLTILANNNPNKIYNLNFPGIGYGGLKVCEVSPLLTILPNNVNVWRH